MKKITSALLCCLALLGYTTASAQRDEQASGNQTKMQERRQLCEQESLQHPAGKRNAFMAQCLKRGLRITDQDRARAAGAPKGESRERICNRQADDRKLTGDERVRYMSTCRKGDVALRTEEKKAQQRQREATCNQQADDRKLTGNERAKYMATCRKEIAAAAAPLSPEKAAREERVKLCRKEADDRKLTGEERRKYVVACRARP